MSKVRTDSAILVLMPNPRNSARYSFLVIAAGSLLLAGAPPGSGREPVKLRPYPQKIVTKYRLEDPRLPREVLAGARTELRTADGALWKRAARGVVRENDREPALDRVQHFFGQRYLADDEVEHISTDPGSSGVWVRTRTGVSHIALIPMTLEEKAARFEQRVKERHDRYGMVAGSSLGRPGDLSTNQLQPNDNDGLWTAMYAASQCFRFAVSRSPEALERARRATEAVLKLEEVTGRPGYPARSYIRRGDRRGAGGVWHWTPDGSIEWKADTSSDEIVGHFYLFGIAYDLLPDAGLRRRIAGAARRIMDHIIDHGWNLTDIHGNPTYWGRWSPEYFATRRGKPDAPLNALELLSFLKTTYHITDEERFQRAYRQVALQMDYARLTTRLNELREEINYSDEELAFLPLYHLFRYEKEASLRRIYQQATAEWWANARRERNPLWIFICAVGEPLEEPDLEAAAHTLYRIPMDLINWQVVNSWRQDLEWTGAPDRFGRRESKTWLPPDERPVMKWNGNPFVVDGGGGGTGEDDGTFFLLPYWMGRYHRLIQEN